MPAAHAVLSLSQALRVLREPRNGTSFRALLATGFTPLHLGTLLQAHLALVTDRPPSLLTGEFGNLAGTLRDADAHLAVEITD